MESVTKSEKGSHDNPARSLVRKDSCTSATLVDDHSSISAGSLDRLHARLALDHAHALAQR